MMTRKKLQVCVKTVPEGLIRLNALLQMDSFQLSTMLTKI